MVIVATVLRRPEEISEFIDIYPEKCDECGGRIKAYEKNYNEHKVVSEILGEKYPGALISDFYSAYNKLQALAKQRCLGHLLAEIKKVQEKNKLALESIDGMFC